MASKPLETEEKTRPVKVVSAPLGAEDEPTCVLLGAETDAAPTSVLSAPAAGREPTAAMSWPANDVPAPRDFESTSVLPWVEPESTGPIFGADCNPTDPGGVIFYEDHRPKPTVPEKPSARPKAPVAPPQFVALGTEVDPNRTQVQQQISPLLIPRPRISLPRRMARRWSADLRLPRGRAARLRYFAIAGLLGLGLLIAVFQLTSWALAQ